MKGQLHSKKIAKNTILLYFRMILGMVVSLYTSRIVLQVLGIDDFGIYNIISGVIVMFSFINTFLTSACQRYISFSIAKDSIDETKRIFSTSLFIHVLVLVIFALASETVGLYFVYNKLVIPESRFVAALYVFQIMVLESCISIFKVPYNATIIAEEKMSFYAYTSIIENVFRLIVVYILIIVPFDKLILYSVLHLLVSVVMVLWYKLYADKNFEYCTNSFRYDRKYLKDMISFSGWNVFGSIADIGYKQGTNIILNLFYGVALNASMGIATTVRSAIYSFINNIQVAANPQIIKSFAIHEFQYYSKLVYRISKYSYYLMLLLAVPVILNVNYILFIWLDEVPEYTPSLIILGLVFCLVDCLHGPLWTSMQATGKIRNYQLLISAILLLNLPVSYLCLKQGCSPNSILIVQILISLLTLVVRLVFSWNYAFIKISDYLRQVIGPVLLVTLVSIPFPYYLSSYFDDWRKLLLTTIASIISVILSVFFIGMNKEERKTVLQMILNFFRK